MDVDSEPFLLPDTSFTSRREWFDEPAFTVIASTVIA